MWREANAVAFTVIPVTVPAVSKVTGEPQVPFISVYIPNLQ